MTTPGRDKVAVAALIQSAAARKQKTKEKIERGKAEALRLIKENDGIYPANGGRLTQAEVCRLGGVDPTILGGKPHRETTRVELNSWLDQVSSGLAKGKRRVRKKINGQVAIWKALYEEVLDSFSIVELELAQTKQELAACQAELNDIRRSQV